MLPDVNTNSHFHLRRANCRRTKFNSECLARWHALADMIMKLNLATKTNASIATEITRHEMSYFTPSENIRQDLVFCVLKYCRIYTFRKAYLYIVHTYKVNEHTPHNCTFERPCDPLKSKSKVE